MSCVVRKPAFCICEKKAADQLCCFHYIDSATRLLSKSKILSLYNYNLLWRYSLVCVGPGQKP